MQNFFSGEIFHYHSFNNKEFAYIREIKPFFFTCISNILIGWIHKVVIWILEELYNTTDTPTHTHTHTYTYEVNLGKERKGEGNEIKWVPHL